MDCLVELGCENVKAGHDCTVWTKFVALHDLLVLHSIADINVCWEGHVNDCGIKVDSVEFFAFSVEL